jgi:gas vesicle protein
VTVAVTAFLAGLVIGAIAGAFAFYLFEEL